MSKNMKAFMAITAAMLSSCASGYGDSPFADTYPSTPKEREKPLSLEDKGLQEFFINGQKIIAHNEREAHKRYKARNKNR